MRDKVIERRNDEATGGAECTDQVDGSRDGKVDKREGAKFSTSSGSS